MALDQLGSFMDALGQFESGGNYQAQGVQTKYGRALGKYQIMSDFWPGWAAAAGIPGADWRDPAAQDHVARTRMTQYYNTYGRWDLVAVAWFAGPGRANQAAKSGIASVAGIADVLGTSVATYVQKVMGNMGQAVDTNPIRQSYTFGDQAATPTPPVPPVRSQQQQLMTEIFSTVSNAIRDSAGATVSTQDVNTTERLPTSADLVDEANADARQPEAI